MKHFIAYVTVALIAVTALPVSAQNFVSFILINGSNGSHVAKLDPLGNATIANVKPGNYQVALLVPAVQKAQEGTSGPMKESMETMKKAWKDASMIDVESWSWGVSSVGTANGGVWKSNDGGSNTGREGSTPSVSDIQVSKHTETPSGDADLYIRKSARPTQATLENNKKIKHAGSDYYKVELTDIMVSSAQPSPSGGAGRPMETLSLNFTKIKYTVR